MSTKIKNYAMQKWNKLDYLLGKSFDYKIMYFLLEYIFIFVFTDCILANNSFHNIGWYITMNVYNGRVF